jgi:hypothetical protein
MSTVGQIIVSDKVLFNSDNSTHSIENIRNSIYMKLFPSVVICEVLVKILNIEEKNYKISLLVKGNDKGFLLYKKFDYNGENKRTEEMVPGIDFSLPVRFAVPEQGNYFFDLYLDEELLAEYPLFVGTEL